MHSTKRLTLTALMLSLSTLAAEEPKEILLLDDTLSKWEIFIGVPHTTVTGLPAGTPQSDDKDTGTPLGLNNDPKKVFTTFSENGTTVLHISGEIYGCVTTKAEYSNYHFQTDFKWGERKWEPRAKSKRDSGILYHCHGEHGAFWKVWKSSLEYQVQETDLGDFFKLAGAKAQARFRLREGEKRPIFDPTASEARSPGSVEASAEPDKPHGEWNRLEVYVLGDSAIHVVNGVVVFALTGALDKNNKQLKSGQIQLQCEGAECFYRNVRLSPINAFPQDIATKAGLTSVPSVKQK